MACENRPDGAFKAATRLRVRNPSTVFLPIKRCGENSLRTPNCSDSLPPDSVPTSRVLAHPRHACGAHRPLTR